MDGESHSPWSRYIGADQQGNTVGSPLGKIPPWALLSLTMNGLLFVAVVVLSLRSALRPSPQGNQGYTPGGRAVAAGNEAWYATVGTRQYLDYHQWVTLLHREAIAAHNAPRLTLLLGDSISLWFPPELLPGRRTWLNQGISGERALGLYQRLDILAGAPVETAFVMVGINDLLGQEPPEQVVANVERIITYLQEHHPQATIVVQSILPHSGAEATWEGRDRLLALPPERIQRVNADVQQIAQDQGVEYLDLYPLFADGEGYLRPELTTDGLHLNPQGYWVWRTAIALFFQETDFQEADF